MNRPNFAIDKYNFFGGNKIYSRITRPLARQYCPEAKIVSERSIWTERYVVNKEKLQEFFRANNVTEIYINEKEEFLEDRQYRLGPYQIVDKTHLIVNCVISLPMNF
jgi:hypothetical protein